jgi:hypothetical protein
MNFLDGRLIKYVKKKKILLPFSFSRAWIYSQLHMLVGLEIGLVFMHAT